MSHSTDAVFALRPGNSPLVLSLPHVGTVIPDALQANFNAGAGGGRHRLAPRPAV